MKHEGVCELALPNAVLRDDFLDFPVTHV